MKKAWHLYLIREKKLKKMQWELTLSLEAKTKTFLGTKNSFIVGFWYLFYFNSFRHD